MRLWHVHFLLELAALGQTPIINVLRSCMRNADIRRTLLQRRDARNQIAQQATSANIKGTVRDGARPQTTQNTAQGGVRKAQVVAGNSGLPTQAALQVVNQRPTGRHLLQSRNQANRDARGQISQQLAQKQIKQTVQNGASLQKTKQATQTGLATTRLVAAPNGLTPQAGALVAKNGK